MTYERRCCFFSPSIAVVMSVVLVFLSAVTYLLVTIGYTLHEHSGVLIIIEVRPNFVKVCRLEKCRDL